MTNNIQPSGYNDTESDFARYLEDNSTGQRALTVSKIAELCGIGELDVSEIAWKQWFEGTAGIAADFCREKDENP